MPESEPLPIASIPVLSPLAAVSCGDGNDPRGRSGADMQGSEPSRFTAALAGIGLYVAYPLVSLAGATVREAAEAGPHCVAALAIDWSKASHDCFNDTLFPPEFVAIPIWFVLLLPFARLAFSMFAPDPDGRSRLWRLAGRSPAASYFPVLQFCGAVGALVCVWLAWSYPLHPIAAPYLIYWAVFIAWFALGAGVSWPRRAAAVRAAVRD